MSNKETSNKIDKLANEITESKTVRKIFKFIVASISAPIIGVGTFLVIASNLHLGGDAAVNIGCVVGLIVFISILMKK